METNIKKGIAALTVIAALGGGAYEGLVSDGPQDKPIANEIVSLRTANTEHIKMADGKILAHAYMEPIHFKDDKGQWKQIDTTLKPKPFILRALSSRPLEVTSGVYHAEVSETKEYNYKFSWNGASVEYEARFDTSKAVSISVQTTRSGVKETIQLLDNSAPTRLEWGLTVDGEIREEPGGFGVYNSDGKLGFLIQAANARDAKGRELPVKTTIEKDVLVAEVSAKGAIFPIIVDPSTTVNTLSTQGGRVYELNATYLTARNTATASQVAVGELLMVGQRNAAGTYYVKRSFMAFPISGMSACTACTLYVNGDDDYSTTDFNICLFGANSYRSTLTGADFSKFDGWAAGGAYSGTRLNDVWNSSSYSANWNAIIFNVAGRDSLFAAKSDTLWMAMVSDEDSAASQPADEEDMNFELTPYLSYTYTVPTINWPTNFLMTPIASAKDSMLITWTKNYSDNVDSLVLYQYPDSVRIATLTKTASTGRIGGLNPYQKYKWYVRADSAGVYGYSNADSCWTCQTFKTENFNFLTTGYTSRVNPSAVYDSSRYLIDEDSLGSGATYLGQTKGGVAGAGKYSVYRHWQDVILPKLIKVQAESLFITGTSDSSTTDFSIVARSGKWHGNTTQDAHYFTFDGWAAGATAYTGTDLITPFSTAGFTTGATLNKMAFSQAGRDTTLKHGTSGTDTLRFILLSSKDISDTAPTNAEYVVINPNAGSSYIKLTYAPPDSAPNNFTLTAISTDSLLVSWNDRSYSERGFIIVDAVAGTIVAGTDTTNQDIESLRVGGLLPNTSYSWKVKAVGGDANGLISAADSCYTKAATLLKPTVSMVTDSTRKIVIDTSGIFTSFTRIALQESISGKFVDWISGALDTLQAGVDSSTAEYRTYANWNGALGDTVKFPVGGTSAFRSFTRSAQ